MSAALFSGRYDCRRVVCAAVAFCSHPDTTLKCGGSNTPYCAWRPKSSMLPWLGIGSAAP